MKNKTLLTLLCLCLGSTPLWGPKGKDDNTPEGPRPVAAAAHPSPESFTLMTWGIETVQSTDPKYAKQKRAMLMQFATTVELEIRGSLTLPNDTTDLMAPFKNVCSLSLTCITSKDLPLLPCPEKLQSLVMQFSNFETISNIQHYTNLHTLKFHAMSFEVTDQGPSKTERLGVLTQLHKLRTLHCDTLLASTRRPPEEAALFIRILDNNPEIEEFQCNACLAEDVVRKLAHVSLRRLSLSYSQLDDARFALLPFGTLEEFSLDGLNTLTTLEPLRGSQLRVFDLANQENLGDTLAQIILSMQNLEELKLSDCRLTDAQAEPLLQLAPKLHKFTLQSSNFRMSPEMRQRLKDAFGDKLKHFSSFLSP